MTYEIITRMPSDSEFSSIYNRDWSPEPMGDENQFATEAEAWDAIEGIKRCGPDWAAAEYDVREIAA